MNILLILLWGLDQWIWTSTTRKLSSGPEEHKLETLGPDNSSIAANRGPSLAQAATVKMKMIDKQSASVTIREDTRKMKNRLQQGGPLHFTAFCTHEAFF